MQYQAMEAAPVQERFGLLSSWMIALGLLAIYASSSNMSQRWPALVFGARVCDILILASGALLLASGVWRLLTQRRRRAATGLGALSAATFAATLFLGVWSGAIPCSGPS